MKSKIILFAIFLTICCSSLFAQVPWHKNQIVLASVNGSTFINYIFEKAEGFGFKKEVIAEFEQVFLKNSGSDLKKDFQNVGLSIYKGEDGKPHGFFFKSGNFKPEKWYEEFEILGNQAIAKSHLKFNLRKVGQHKIIDFTSAKPGVSGPKPVFSLCFHKPGRVIFSSNSEIDYALKAKITDAPAPIAKQAQKQTFFLQADIAILSAAFKNAPNPALKAASSMLAAIDKLYVFLADGKLQIRLICRDEESSKNFAQMINGMVASYRQKLDNDIKMLKAPADGKGWFLNSLFYFSKKGSLLSSKETLDAFSVANKNKTVLIKSTLPPIVQTGIVPVAMVGVLAAIAIPNFQKARNQARQKACFANQRVLLGATEMYNMDNSEMQTTINDQFLDKLVKGGYLKAKPVCPEGGTYSSEGDLTGEGKITCSKHGSYEDYRR